MKIMTRLFLCTGEKGSGSFTTTSPSLWPLKTT